MVSALVWKVAGGLLGTALLGGGVFVATNPTAQMMVMGPPRADAVFGAAGSGSAAVPLDLFRGSRIFLRGKLNDRTVAMLLDSGAGMTVVDQSYARQIGLRAEGAMTVQGSGGPQNAEIATGVTIEIGALRLENAAVLIMDLSAVATGIGRPLPMILGRDAFENSVVELDLQGGTIRFTNPRTFTPPAGAVQLPLMPEGHSGTRTIPVSINGLPPVTASFDLGNGGAIIVSRSYWTSQNLLSGLRSSEAMGGGVGGARIRTIATLGSVSIAGQTFRDVPALFNREEDQLPTSGVNVGTDLLRRFRMAIDYSRDLIYLTPDQAAMQQPLRKDRAGLRLDFAGDRLRVLHVAPGGPAAAAGLAAGDEITAVNGQPVSTDFYSREGADWAAGPAGTSVDLLRADGTYHEIVLRDYF